MQLYPKHRELRGIFSRKLVVLQDRKNGSVISWADEALATSSSNASKRMAIKQDSLEWDGKFASVLVERSWCMNQSINIHTAHTSEFYLWACLMIGHQKVDEVSQWGIQISWHRVPLKLFLLKKGSVTMLPLRSGNHHVNLDPRPLYSYCNFKPSTCKEVQPPLILGISYFFN